MLPTNTLQVGELITSDHALGDATRLSDAAAEPESNFAGLLRLNIDTDLERGDEGGEWLPSTGNFLPLLPMQVEVVASYDDAHSISIDLHEISVTGREQQPTPVDLRVVRAAEVEYGPDPQRPSLKELVAYRPAESGEAAPSLLRPESSAPPRTMSSAGTLSPQTLGTAVSLARQQSDISEQLTTTNRPSTRTDRSGDTTPILPGLANVRTKETLLNVRSAANRRDRMPESSAILPSKSVPDRAPTGAPNQPPAFDLGSRTTFNTFAPDSGLLKALPQAKPFSHESAPQVWDSLTASSDDNIDMGPSSARPDRLASGQSPSTGQISIEAASIARPTEWVGLQIHAPVEGSGWDKFLSERVVVMASNKLQNAEIRVTPAELGPLRVRLTIDDGAANVTFQAQHPVTREAIEQAMPRLREMLAENGLTLNQTSVSGESGDGVKHGSRDDAGQNRLLSHDAAVADSDSEESLKSRGRKPAENSLVDTFA